MVILNGRHQDSTVDILDHHAHSVCHIYPELAGPVTLTKAGGAWAAYPTPTEVVPVNTITDVFDIHFVMTNAMSANGNFSIALYKGAAGVEELIAVIPASRTAAISVEGALPCITQQIPANTRISAALSSSNAAADTVAVKILYHTYD